MFVTGLYIGVVGTIGVMMAYIKLHELVEKTKEKRNGILIETNYNKLSISELLELHRNVGTVYIIEDGYITGVEDKNE